MVDGPVCSFGATIERRDDVDFEVATKKILSSWLRPLINRDWVERLALIEEVDMSIRTDFGEGDLSRRISQSFTEKVIDQLCSESVVCREQAFIYLNSNALLHRQAGRAWLVIHEPDYPLFDEDHPSLPISREAERRRATRHRIDLPGTVSINGLTLDAKMVDLSVSGACLSMDNPPKAGDRVFINVALLGRMAASVVWVTSSLMGLMFITDHASAFL